MYQDYIKTLEGYDNHQDEIKYLEMEEEVYNTNPNLCLQLETYLVLNNLQHLAYN